LTTIDLENQALLELILGSKGWPGAGYALGHWGPHAGHKLGWKNGWHPHHGVDPVQWLVAKEFKLFERAELEHKKRLKEAKICAAKAEREKKKAEVKALRAARTQQLKDLITLKLFLAKAKKALITG
jgi:hypothetical protein